VQTIWLKLVEANLLQKFEDHIQKQVPQVLTAVEACDVLGVSWNQWVTAMWGYHKGYPIKKQGQIVGRRQSRWMPTPINLAAVGYTSKVALFDFEDIIRLSTDQKRCANGTIKNAFRVIGREVRAGVVLGGERPEGAAKLPEATTTQAQFRNYLTMAVLNHYANYCRTQFRRHKEKPHKVPAYMEDDAPSWEATLPDTASADADTLVALSEAKQMLSHTLFECLDGVPTCKPVSEHEIEMFEQLEKGASLMQALESLNIPHKVKTAILNTVRPRAPEFAP